MNSTIKSICAFLKSERPEVQHSAAVVLLELQVSDLPVLKAVGEALSYAREEKTTHVLVEILRNSPHEQSIGYLLKVAGASFIPEDCVAGVISGIGSKSLSVLKKIYPKADNDVKKIIASVVPRLRGEQSFVFLKTIFLSDNADQVKAAVHSLRESIFDYTKKDRTALHKCLKSSITDKRYKSNNLSLSALIISLGIAGESKSKKLLLPYVSDDNDETIRRYALKSLASLEYSGEGHGDIIKNLFPLLLEENDMPVLAIDVLLKVKPRKSDSDALIKIMQSHPNPLVQTYAVKALGMIESKEHINILIDTLYHQDHNLRNAAVETLTGKASVLKYLLKRLDDLDNVEAAKPVVDILKSMREHVSDSTIKTLLKKMVDALRNADISAKVYLKALLAIDGDSLTSWAANTSKKSFNNKDYIFTREVLELLIDTDLMDGDMKLRLVIAKLKSCMNDTSPDYRSSDYALSIISELLHEEGKEFVKSFFAISQFSAEEYLYVGTHFSERLHEERRFGIDCLNHVVENWSASTSARVAKKLLKR